MRNEKHTGVFHSENTGINTMIRIVLGNVGSGKSATIVREMVLSNIPIHSNIVTKKIPNNTLIKKEHIFKEHIVRIKKTGEPEIKLMLNSDYWKKLKQQEPTTTVILDEAHTLLNPRRSMSKKNEVMTDFLALLRRIIGTSSLGQGELILITQLERRLDVIAKEMATLVQYCICHYTKECNKCHTTWNETNEMSKKLWICPNCSHNGITRHSFVIEIFNFKNIEKYNLWHEYKQKTYFEKQFVTNIELIFPLYDTLQWDNLLSD